MDSRTLVSMLLDENDNVDDIDASDYLGYVQDDVTFTEYPGYVARMVRVGRYVVYYNPNLPNRSEEAVANILFDDQEDMPAEAKPHWEGLHWICMADFSQAGGGFKTLKDAFTYAVERHRERLAKYHGRGRVAESDDEMDPSYYVDHLINTSPGLDDLKQKLKALYSNVQVHTSGSDPHAHDLTWSVSFSSNGQLPDSIDGVPLREHVIRLIGSWAVEHGYLILGTAKEMSGGTWQRRGSARFATWHFSRHADWYEKRPDVR